MMVAEFDIHQNPALSGLALWAFAREHVERSVSKEGPSILLSYTVLPLVYNVDVTSIIHARNMDAAGLYRLLENDKELIVDLQKRMQVMWDQTNAGLDLAFASKLLSYDASNMTLQVLRRSNIEQNSDSTREILASAKRLGGWYSAYNPERILSMLGITF